ncbi:MAG: hypothetical protein OXE49_18230, partial [Gemmatimonadetes bacterium]|nr:hypothetical protein [Gemmatimonadota bacterium]
YLPAKAEAESPALSGLKSTSNFVYGVAYEPLLAYQGGGALIAMVLLGLWTGRGHLRDVWRKALSRHANIDDGDEIMSYRAAVLGVTFGTGGIAGWLWLMGTPFWVGALFAVVALLVFIGISRVVCEAGLAAIRSPMIAPDLIVQGIGSQTIGAAGVFNLSFAYIWSADIRIFLLAMVANGLKLIQNMDRHSRRVVFWAVVAAIFIGVTGSCWMVFHLAYKYGGINLDGWRFHGGPSTIYNAAQRALEPAGADWLGLTFFAGGAVVMGLLAWARHHVLWWPFHPIGFPIGANFMLDKIWACVLLAWALKKLILRFGGAAHYRTSQHFFMGLIMGEALCNGLWLVIDYFTGKIGNAVFILG